MNVYTRRPLNKTWQEDYFLSFTLRSLPNLIDNGIEIKLRKKEKKKKQRTEGIHKYFDCVT